MSEETNSVASAASAAPAAQASIASSESAVPAAQPVAAAGDVSSSAAPSTDANSTTVIPAVETVSGGPIKTSEAVTPAQSVLGEAVSPETQTKTDETKDTSKDGAAEPTEISKEAAPLPIYEAFTLPENITVDKEPMDAFTKLLGEMELGKPDHEGLQKYGQELVDMHIKGVQDVLRRNEEYYVNMHEQQKADWYKSFESDAEIGGNHKDTTIGHVRSAIESYGGSKEQVAEFRKVMQDTGVGNNPSVIRLIANMDAALRKYTSEDGSKIIPASRPAPSKVKDYQKMYSGNQG